MTGRYGMDNRLCGRMASLLLWFLLDFHAKCQVGGFLNVPRTTESVGTTKARREEQNREGPRRSAKNSVSSKVPSFLSVSATYVNPSSGILSNATDFVGGGGVGDVTGVPNPLAADAAALTDGSSMTSVMDVQLGQNDHRLTETVEFVSFRDISNQKRIEQETRETAYPLAGMLQGAACYVAGHLDSIAVFYIPGELLDNPDVFGNLIDDIALTWMMGLKLVLVVGNRYYSETCSIGGSSSNDAATGAASSGRGSTCQNTLRATDERLIRDIEEEAGYVRFEVERMLNRKLRLHGGMSPQSTHSPMLNGNVVGGNFFHANKYGLIKGIDYGHAGYASQVSAQRIRQVLDNNDVVLLPSVGYTVLGDVVSVNGNHLAATVASALRAQKLIYLSTHGAVLRERGATESFQDVPLDVAQSIVDSHRVDVHPKWGLANFGHAQGTMAPAAVELLLHMAWSTWAMTKGAVSRAHIVNPYDGALLEELFTSANGVNTCIYHPPPMSADWDDDDDLDSFF